GPSDPETVDPEGRIARPARPHYASRRAIRTSGLEIPLHRTFDAKLSVFSSLRTETNASDRPEVIASRNVRMSGRGGWQGRADVGVPPITHSTGIQESTVTPSG
ncbi:MAG TPA: hypothetical protein VFT74_01875, partial [Isosphaeraceae bacterium]|nr:hypothetical protein [Isosphaeraceae bacterium]